MRATNCSIAKLILLLLKAWHCPQIKAGGQVILLIAYQGILCKSITHIIKNVHCNIYLVVIQRCLLVARSPAKPDKRIAAVPKLQSGPHSKHQTGLNWRQKMRQNQNLNIFDGGSSMYGAYFEL